MYGNLKLHNVFLDHKGHTKVTDYGLRVSDTTSLFYGNLNYTAPEITRKEDYNFRYIFHLF